MKRLSVIFVLSLAFFIISCQDAGMQSANENSTVYKIEYYSVRVKVTPVENSVFPDIEYFPVLITTDECQGSKNYTIADYNDMTDEWDWERDEKLDPFSCWYTIQENDEHKKDTLAYSDKRYNNRDIIKIEKDITLYTAWGQPPTRPR